MSDFKYTIVDGIDHTIDEKGNSFIALRKMFWGDKPESAKLELRKYHNNANGDETPSKGVSFITDDGPTNLTHVLINMGYGNTERILNGIKDREDFRPSLNKVLGKDDEFYDNTIPEDTYVPDENMFDYDE